MLLFLLFIGDIKLIQMNEDENNIIINLQYSPANKSNYPVLKQTVNIFSRKIMNLLSNRANSNRGRV